MGKMKRRVIYTTDEEWAELRAKGLAEGKTISNIIREATGEPPLLNGPNGDVTHLLGRIPTPVQAFRPAPKPSRK